MKEKRKLRRMFVFCRVLDQSGQFIGYALDISKEGIRMMVQRSHPDVDSFAINMKSPDRMQADLEVTAKVRKVWRSSKNNEFDEIGCRFESLGDAKAFGDFLTYFEQISQKYSLDI